MSQQAPGKGMGRVFMIVAWCAGLYLATQFFGRWEQRQDNPNTDVISQQGEGFIEVKLLANVQGHLVASGRMNNVPVEFLLDTGATDVAVPLDLAEQLALPKGAPVTLSTANGRAQGYRTQIDRLQLGAIVLRNVRAVAAPGLEGEQVLLGMSALNKLEFTQRGGTMLLRQTTN
ncbi:TIGR02281 family clan AA aspartic protease [Pseudomonas helleri]|uniref:TIGR02281 family clan AA aspartic protease n=1 Tax=Pseudomonas helleri TaxID=1608996 RepID=A0A6G1W6B8_9PSED|nr:TIGR02281 family clan AA aspartic protease [Pseudomonas helleri]MQT26606.1 TIGR02281 family clan AA aspartic protease [Pseudomonas helleri]MQU18106.1 TIGR02281 family clan AA aspartic protease [Pseudomonas helleri]